MFSVSLPIEPFELLPRTRVSTLVQEARMIKMLESPDYVTALKVSGTLTAEDYDRIVADVEAKLDRHDRLGVLLDLVDFKDLSPEAAAKDIRYSLSKIWELKRFPREAIVTDKAWIRALSRIASPLVPHV